MPRCCPSQRFPPTFISNWPDATGTRPCALWSHPSPPHRAIDEEPAQTLQHHRTRSACRRVTTIEPVYDCALPQFAMFEKMTGRTVTEVERERCLAILNAHAERRQAAES